MSRRLDRNSSTRSGVSRSIELLGHGPDHWLVVPVDSRGDSVSGLPGVLFVAGAGAESDIRQPADRATVPALDRQVGSGSIGHDGFLTRSRRRRTTAKTAQGETLAQAVQEATGENIDLADVDQGCTGAEPAEVAAEHGIDLLVVKLPEGKRGFVLLPRRWVIERSFGWLARDYERLPETQAGLHFIAFAILMLQRAAVLFADSSEQALVRRQRRQLVAQALQHPVRLATLSADRLLGFFHEGERRTDLRLRLGRGDSAGRAER